MQYWSGFNYRVIKFIARRRIKLAMGDSVFQFFYPFEVQIMDNDTYVSLQSGPSEHKLYKDRQAKAARERILGVEVEPEF